VTGIAVELPWRAAIGMRRLGLAATFEEAIEIANLGARGRPAWVTNAATEEAWFGTGGDWKRVWRARGGGVRSGAPG
jgi:hypothetical protein